ncbi:hypothetical protein B0H12DRAFT_1222710 [Mycena haematopus]|nr:hypothetical protein B0H12DRAFT_1222710 [Mycena haematopus]
MASDDLKKADSDEAITEQQNPDNSPGAEEQTDAFQCSKCKQRKCRYRQVQTRGPDEPMTTFITCMNCNSKWRFS